MTPAARVPLMTWLLGTAIIAAPPRAPDVGAIPRFAREPNPIALTVVELLGRDGCRLTCFAAEGWPLVTVRARRIGIATDSMTSNPASAPPMIPHSGARRTTTRAMLAVRLAIP